MAKISIGDSTEELVEVDLWGTEYKAVRITKSVQKQMDKAVDKLDKAETAEQTVKAVGGLLDLRLEAVNGAGLPSTIVAEKWAADELSLGQLLRFSNDLVTAEVPT